MVSLVAALQAALAAGDTQALVFFVFDMLFAEQEDLRGLPLSDRKARLRALIESAGFKVRGWEEATPAPAPQPPGESAAVSATIQSLVMARPDFDPLTTPARWMAPP